MIYYKVNGQGLPVVLLHGYGENHTLWLNLVKSHSKSFKTIALDLPGFGKSKRLTGNFSIDDVADRVHDFLISELKINQYVILGHSLGGYVALALAERYPHNLLGFGLINSTALADSPEKKENRLKTAAFIKKYGTSFFLENFVPNLFAENNRKRLVEQIRKVKEMGLDLEEEVLARYMLAMKDRPDRKLLLSKFNHVLFVGGALDSSFTAADFEKQLNELKNRANWHILPRVGHMSMFEAPRELEAISYKFLKSV